MRFLFLLDLRMNHDNEDEERRKEKERKGKETKQKTIILGEVTEYRRNGNCAKLQAENKSKLLLLVSEVNEILASLRECISKKNQMKVDEIH
jgi:hypothetical protein